MFKIILRILLCSFFIRPLAAQEKLGDIGNSEINLTRSRILIGYSNIIRKDQAPTLRSFFLNVNYRTSNLDQFSKPFKISFAFEAGFNGLKINDKGFHGVAFVPYIKAGPEMSLIKYLFLGGNVGIASSILGYFAIFPYGGVNCYYLLPMRKDLFIEFEFGYHTTFFFDKTPYLFYFSAGVAIK